MALKVNNMMGDIFYQVKNIPRWQILLIALSILAALRELIPTCKSLENRCSLENDIVTPLIRKIQDYQSMIAFKNTLIKKGHATLSLNSTLWESIVNTRGSLYLKKNESTMEIYYKSGLIKTRLHDKATQQVSLLIFPTADHIRQLFKEAITEVAANPEKYDRPSGGGDAKILGAKTKDGRIWNLLKDYGSYRLEQYSQKGYTIIEACIGLEKNSVQISEKEIKEWGL